MFIFIYVFACAMTKNRSFEQSSMCSKGTD